MNGSIQSENQEEKHGFKIRYVFFAIVLLLFYLAILSHNPEDLNILAGGSGEAVKNLIGPVGAHLSCFLLLMFGLAVYPVVLFLTACLFRSFFLKSPRKKGYRWAVVSTIIGTVLLFGLWPESSSALTAKLGIGSGSVPEFSLSGGLIGQYFAAPESTALPAGLIRRYIGLTGTLVTALVFLLSGLFWIILSDWKDFLAKLTGFHVTISRDHGKKEEQKEFHRYAEDEKNTDERQQEKTVAVKEPEPSVSSPAVEEEVRETPPAEEPPATEGQENIPEKAPEEVSSPRTEVIQAQNGTKGKSPITAGLAGENTPAPPPPWITSCLLWDFSMRRKELLQRTQSIWKIPSLHCRVPLTVSILTDTWCVRLSVPG